MLILSFLSRGSIRISIFVGAMILGSAEIFPDAAQAQTAQTSSSISYGKLKPPKYPPEAIREKVSGIVYVHVHVDATGKADDVQVDPASDSGKELLQRSAISAVKSWQFNPAMRDGHPVPGDAIIPLRFTVVGQAVPQFSQPGPPNSPDMPVLEVIDVTGRRVNHR